MGSLYTISAACDARWPPFGRGRVQGGTRTSCPCPRAGSGRKKLRRRRGDGGAVLVEVARVMPIMVLVVLGIMDFGYMVNRDMLIDNASRDGTRVASLGGSFSQVCSAVKAEL